MAMVDKSLTEKDNMYKHGVFHVTSKNQIIHT